MEIKIIQQTNELYASSFNIISSDGGLLGTISFCGSMGSMEGEFRIDYLRNTIIIAPTSIKKASDIGRQYVDCSFFRKPYRPYEFNVNGYKGIIFHHQVKNLCYRFLHFNGDTLFMYVLGFGEKGICAPIYRDEECVSEIHKDAVVYDGLHQFTICFKNQDDIILDIILCCYMYVIEYYKAGEKVKKGISKKIYISKDKEELSKCTNPYYIQ